MKKGMSEIIFVVPVLGADEATEKSIMVAAPSSDEVRQ